MTAAQWIFHYKECMREEKKRAKEKRAILDILEVQAFYSHPKIDLQKMTSKIEERKLREKAPDMQRELEADYELAKSMLPQTLSVTLEEDDKPKPVLPLSKRKRKQRLKSRLKKKDL